MRQRRTAKRGMEQGMADSEHDYWAVGLKGQERDLELLMSFECVDWRIETIEGAYYLVAPEFQAFSDAWDVSKAADEIIEDIGLAAGVMSKEFKSVQPEKVYQVFQDGDRIGHVFLAARIGVVAGVRATLSGGRTPYKPYKEAFESIRAHPAARDAAHYFALRGDGWTFFLWKVYEIIRQDTADDLGVRKEHALGPKGVNWVDEDTFKRFRTCIDDRTVSGDDARHALPLENPHSRPMNRSEAESFIQNLLLKWLRWKYDNGLK